MTPVDLYQLLGLGLFAVIALTTTISGALLLPRIRRGAKQGSPRLAVFYAAATAMLLLMLAKLPIPGAEWVTSRITGGWGYYYASVLWIIFVLAVPLALLLCAAVLALSEASLTWLQQPPSPNPEWAAVTNRQSLHRRWRIFTTENRVVRAITKHLTGNGTIQWERAYQPNNATTSFSITPAPSDLQPLRAQLAEHFAGTTSIASISADNETDPPTLQVIWNLPELDGTHHSPHTQGLRIGSHTFGRRTLRTQLAGALHAAKG